MDVIGELAGAKGPACHPALTIPSLWAVTQSPVQSWENNTAAYLKRAISRRCAEAVSTRPTPLTGAFHPGILLATNYRSTGRFRVARRAIRLDNGGTSSLEPGWRWIRSTFRGGVNPAPPAHGAGLLKSPIECQAGVRDCRSPDESMCLG